MDTKFELEAVLDVTKPFVWFENGRIKKTNIARVTNSSWTFPSGRTQCVFTETTATHTRLKFKVDKYQESDVDMLFYHMDSNSIYDVEGELEEGATLRLMTIHTTKEKGHFRYHQQIEVKENASIYAKHFASYQAEATIHQKYMLVEERALAKIENVWLNTANAYQDIEIEVHHQKKHTKSDVQHYALSGGTSTLKIDTIGRIDKDASKSELKQSTKGIILDLHAMISATPLLKIDEYDVVAGHGASIGAIDDDQLYYMMSRGLSKEDSEKIILEGFIAPMIDTIPEGKLKNTIISLIEDKI